MNKEDWEVKKLGEVFELYQPKTISASDMIEDGKYPVFGANGIIGNYNQYNHKDIELLLTCRGATCGTINISQPFSWINGNAMVIHPKNADSMIFKFVYYQLLGADLSSVITGAAQPQITRKSLKVLDFHIPPLPIQTQIVAELDELNAILDKKRKQLEELDTLAQATFYDMFGDPVLNDKGWEVKKLNQLAVLKAGKFIKASDIASDNTGLLYKCYGANGLRGYVSAYNHFGTHVLIGRQGALCGNVTLAKGKFYATEHAVVVTPLIKSESLWLLYILDYLNLNRYATGAAQPGLSVNKINNIIIPFPPIVLQHQFAERIEAIEAQKELINQSIKEVQLLFDYTMDKYFN